MYKVGEVSTVVPARGVAVAELSIKTCHIVPLSAASHPTVTEVAVRPVRAIPVTLGQGGTNSINKSSMYAYQLLWLPMLGQLRMTIFLPMPR